MVERLLRRGADVNAATIDGRTALMMAAMHGWSAVVEALIQSGAKVQIEDTRGRIAIDYAKPTDSEVRAFLIRSGSSRGSGRSGRVVCDAQAALNALGLRKGHPDCWWGTSTADSVKQFQRQRGLSVSGELDSATVEALGVKQ